MTHKAATMIVALCLIAPALGEERHALRLHLLRTVRVGEGTLQLGSLGVLRGDDPKLVRKASSIAMGRPPLPDEKIVVSRPTILSRLASNGIKKELVRITGAEKVVVERNSTVIEAERLLQLAESFLEKPPPGPPRSGWRLAAQPKNLVVLAAKDIQLTARLGKDCPEGHVKVEIAATSDGQEVGVASVLFKLVYRARQIVAAKDILSGQTITPENTRIKIISVEREPRDDWTSPYGMVAVRSIDAGTVIRLGLVRAKKLTILVRRNQTVQMKIEGLSFVVTATGKALQQGRAGEWIKVQNIDSNRIIDAKVAFDGTVRPAYNER